MGKFNVQQFANNAVIQGEISRSLVDKFSFEVYKKSPDEQAILATMKHANKKAVKKAGHDPKKRLNINEPMCAKYALI